MSPVMGPWAACSPEEPQEGFLREVAELVLMDEEERAVKGHAGKSAPGQRGPSYEEGEVGRLGGHQGGAELSRAAGMPGAKCVRPGGTRRRRGPATLPERFCTKLRHPPAGEVAGRAGSEFRPGGVPLG